MARETEDGRRHWLALVSILALAFQALLNRFLPGTAYSSSAAIPGPPVAFNTTIFSPDAWTLPFSRQKLEQYKNDSWEMFHFSYKNYMEHAFPRDDLRPISCRGSNSQGGIALTMLDALDALIIFDDVEGLRKAVKWVGDHPNLFDVDARVHVFEVTIRALGGLLSSHNMLLLDRNLVPAYDGCLLRAAVDLADRLLPAFETPSGLPLSWVNLKRGRVVGDTRVTCTACAGTLLLEFGVLSRTTGIPVYEAKARRAVEYLWNKRSARGLVGNTINVDTGKWVRRDAGVGAGVDSFYEYLLKAYLAFGEPVYLEMFAEAYASAQANLALSPTVNGISWLVTAHMQTGRVMNHYVSSLAAFWPGMQALAGQIADGLVLHADWVRAWSAYKWLPESFTLNMQHMHPTMTSYPLRPELAESTYMLYTATGEPKLLEVAAKVLERIRDGARAKCGYASIGDVGTSRLEDTMESFFLAETAKYLYLTFTNATTLIDNYVLSTEGHLFLPFLPASAAVHAELPKSLIQGNNTTKKSGGVDDSLVAAEKQRCAAVCVTLDSQKSAERLQAALPKVPVLPRASDHIRRRRCVACRAVSRELVAARKKADELWKINADSAIRAGRPHVAPAQWTLSRFQAELIPEKAVLCTIAEVQGKLNCVSAKVVPISSITSQSVQALSQNAVFFQFGQISPDSYAAETVAMAMMEVQVLDAVDSGPSASEANTNTSSSRKNRNNSSALRDAEVLESFPAMLAEFGPELLPGCDISKPGSVGASWVRFREMLETQEAMQALDNEEASEEGETEEEVRRRIAAIERGEMVVRSDGTVVKRPAGSGDASGDGAGGSNAQQQQILFEDDEDPYLDPDEDDEDPYIDPDELENTEEKKEETSAVDSTIHVAAEISDDSFDEEQERQRASIPRNAPVVCQSTGPLVKAIPADACVEQLENAAQVQGGVALILRGNCSFHSKVLAAERAGAIAAVVVNVDPQMRSGGSSSGSAAAVEQEMLEHRGYGGLMHMAAESPETGGINRPNPTIPAVMVREMDGEILLDSANSCQYVRIQNPMAARKSALAEELVKYEHGAEEGQAAGRADGKSSAKERPTSGSGGAVKGRTKSGIGGGEDQGVCSSGGGEDRGLTQVQSCSAEKHHQQQQSGPFPTSSSTTTKTEQPCSENISEGPQFQLEIVVPLNSQQYLMHQIYQLNHDITPAFKTAAMLLQSSSLGNA